MVRAHDFVFDTTASGQQIKCLTVIDEFTRECLAIDVAGAIRPQRVIEVLSRLVSLHGAPLFVRSDSGPEFVSQAILEWISGCGIATVLNDPRKPWQNGSDESFSGKFRNECLSLEWFRSRREAAVLIESWRKPLQRGTSAEQSAILDPWLSSSRNFAKTYNPTSSS